MAYYIRVLGAQNVDVSVEELSNDLKEKGLTAELRVEETKRGKWTRMHVLNAKGLPLAQLEKDVVKWLGLGKEEIGELIEEIKDEMPVSAVKWLTTYLKRVKVIYAFRMFGAASEDENFEIISAIRTRIWKSTGGIIQSDHESFSNEEGDVILWQLSDELTGEWRCAVISESGEWQRFRMDMGDMQQRKDFCEGKVPAGSIPL